MQSMISLSNTRVSALTVTLALVALTGCVADSAEPRTGQSSAAATGPLELDVLFVVDNSGSMGDEQASLAANFDLLIGELATLPGGLPSLHIGVVSTDAGAGGFSIPGCNPGGDAGALQDEPRVSGCTPPADPFIADIILADGSRQQNYGGALEDAFQCVGLLGINGCGFEQPLESMRQALDATDAGEPNDGFLRSGAYLAVIVISDEDDCSAQDAAVFDPSQDDINDPLGPISSFRCYEFGLHCDGGVIARAPATYTTCEPRGDSFLHHTDDYAGFLSSLKPNPNRVFVGVIAGDTNPLTVNLNGIGNPEVAAACTSPNGSAAPAYRLRSFAEAFNHNLFTSICSPDLDVPLGDVAQQLKLALIDGEANQQPDPDSTDEPAGCRASRGDVSGWPLVALGVILLGLGGRPRSRPTPRA